MTAGFGTLRRMRRGTEMVVALDFDGPEMVEVATFRHAEQAENYVALIAILVEAVNAGDFSSDSELADRVRWALGVPRPKPQPPPPPSPFLDSKGY